MIYFESSKKSQSMKCEIFIYIFSFKGIILSMKKLSLLLTGVYQLDLKRGRIKNIRYNIILDDIIF